jgi:hypothetical protein
MSINEYIYIWYYHYDFTRSTVYTEKKAIKLYTVTPYIIYASWSESRTTIAIGISPQGYYIPFGNGRLYLWGHAESEREVTVLDSEALGPKVKDII